MQGTRRSWTVLSGWAWAGERPAAGPWTGCAGLSARAASTTSGAIRACASAAIFHFFLLSFFLFRASAFHLQLYFKFAKFHMRQKFSVCQVSVTCGWVNWEKLFKLLSFSIFFYLKYSPGSGIWVFILHKIVVNIREVPIVRKRGGGGIALYLFRRRRSVLILEYNIKFFNFQLESYTDVLGPSSLSEILSSIAVIDGLVLCVVLRART